MIGIPYAFWDESAFPKLVHICPVCDERIPERSIKGGAYAEHYSERHARCDHPSIDIGAGVCTRCGE